MDKMPDKLKLPFERGFKTGLLIYLNRFRQLVDVIYIITIFLVCLLCGENGIAIVIIGAAAVVCLIDIVVRAIIKRIER
jgi:hypothetical protein